MKLALLLVVLAAPIVTWAAKPARVVAPELAGMTCPDRFLCVEDLSRYAAAADLYEASLQFVSSSAAPPAHRPRVIFCSSIDCFQRFGFSRAAGQTVGTFGIVIAPRGWKPHVVRHEMIHHVQNERLGSLRAWLLTPQWFIEGMAYSLSGDPRPVLTHPWGEYRARFDAWYAKVAKDRVWDEARRL